MIVSLKRVLIFGTGSGWRNIRKIFDYKKISIEAFVDNNPTKASGKINNKMIILPDEIKNCQYDYILIASQYYDEIINQLLGLKVPKEKIIPFYQSASLFEYDWIEYINPKYLTTSIVMKKIIECETEIVRKFRDKNMGQVKRLFESYQKVYRDTVKSMLLKMLIMFEEKQIKEGADLIVKELNEYGFCLSYTPNRYTQITFKEKEVPSFVSVIIPVYKDAIGLKDTLESLSEQTIDLVNFEIIVVNDGGDPDITALCEKYQVQVMEQKPNRGSYYARNRGLEISKGEFLAFVDADIKVPNDWLAKGINALNDYDYVAGGIKIDATKINSLTNYYELKTAFPVNNYILFGHYGPTANLFVKRKVFNEIGGFDERLRSGGDKEFGERIYRFTNCKQTYSNALFVTHPPRDYRGLLKKQVRIYGGHRDLATLYPERYKLQKIGFRAFLKEVLTPPCNVVCDKAYPFGYLKLFLYYWWMKNINLYNKKKYAGILIE